MSDWVYYQLPNVDSLKVIAVRILKRNIEMEDTTVFTIAYILISFCLVVPPMEFISAGLTVQNLLSGFLGSEELNFVYYHVKRVTATMVFHSLLPFGYYVGMSVMKTELLSPWKLGQLWQLYFLFSVALPLFCGLVAFYWSRHQWRFHPMCKRLTYLSDTGSWRSVASSINIEFRRIDKFETGLPGRRIYVTDSWVIKISTYHLDVAHQSDIHLTLTLAQEHEYSYDSLQGVQFLHISVASVNPNIPSFIIRLNAVEYNDLKDKLQAPVRNARNIVVRQSIGERFVHSFREQVNQNPVYISPKEVELENCIGCMAVPSSVKIQKLCDEQNEGDCTPCFCRPLWCVDCMGKWFASRQDQQRPETWMSERAPCPMCRAKFCVLDVCTVVPSEG